MFFFKTQIVDKASYKSSNDAFDIVR